MKITPPEKTSNDLPPVYEFAEFSFDATDKVLYKSGEIIQLTPKACELLDVFIKNAGKILSKDELMNQVWAEMFVEEANLTHHISALRKALGEDKNGKKFIETIPRKGYRFVATIAQASSGAAEITINERTAARAIEEFEVETSEIEKAYENQPLVQFAGENSSEITKAKNLRRKFSFVMPVLLVGGLLAAATIFGWRWFASSGDVYAPSPQTITFKRLTPDQDAVGAAISPDGKYAAYTLYENGSESIWRKNLTNGETVQLTPTHLSIEKLCGFTRYSPDGEWLYFKCIEENNSVAPLYRIPAAGGVSQKIIKEVATDYAFSPDGKQIAYLFGNRQLIIIAADGSGAQRVLAERDGVKQLFPHYPAGCPGWSPDGKRIVIPGSVIERGKEIFQLVEIDAQTGGESFIPTPPNLFFQQIHWIADGSGLITTTTEDFGWHKQIKHVSYPDGKITPLTNDNLDYPLLQLTKDSRTIIAHRNMGQVNLWTAPAEDLSSRRQITTGSSADHGESGLDFAPGGKIIYTSTQTGNLELWGIGADGNGQKQLTKDSGKYNAYPETTADGLYIVFQSRRSGTNHIWRIDAADGRNPLQLSRSDLVRTPRISPDGKWVYYGSQGENGGQATFKVSIDGGEPVQLDDRDYPTAPKFSPDDKWMFYNWREKEDAPPVSYLKNLATGEDVKLPESFDGKWSPDSKSILFMKTDKELWRFDIADYKMRKIADFNPALLANFAVSRDGQTYVFSLGNYTSEIVLIENFLSGETK